MRSLFLAGISLCAAGISTTAGAQLPSPANRAPVETGSVRGASVKLVSHADLRPDEVTVINLHARYPTVVELPYPVAKVHAGDPKIFDVEAVGNKLIFYSKKLSAEETNMFVFLGDPDLTVVPFLIRTDTTQAPVYVLKLSDPRTVHLNKAEEAIATKLRQDEAVRVSTLAEARIQQRLLAAGDVVALHREARFGRSGDQLIVRIETAQILPGEGDRPRLYLRYVITNQTIAPLDDLQLTAQIVSNGVKTKEPRDIYDVSDVRTSPSILPGATAIGLLVMDIPELAPDETLTLKGSAFHGARMFELRDVMGAPKRTP